MLWLSALVTWRLRRISTRDYVGKLQRCALVNGLIEIFERGGYDCLKHLSINDAIEELMYSLLWAVGDNVCKQAAYHPPPQRDLMYVFDRNGGMKQQSNMSRQL